MPAKPHMNLITAGHVDHGKSTIIGRLLFDSGAIREDELRKLRQEAQEYKVEGGEFAFILDKEKEERWIESLENPHMTAMGWSGRL